MGYYYSVYMTQPSFKIVKELLEENCGDTTGLLWRYPCFNPDKNTPAGLIPYLHRACSFDSLLLVKGLLAVGADPQLRDDLGYPPIFYASARLPGSSPNIMLWLLTNSVKARSTVTWTTDSGWGPLYITARSGNAAMARIILKYGADPRAHRLEGLLPSELARRSGNYVVAKTFEAAETMIDLGEWRPWNHDQYPSTYRQAMRTLLLIAKVHSSD